MPVTLSHPGVYIQEIPSGSRTITGAATSVAAFVGRALRGLVDTPVPIGSYAEFERAFGGLWRDSGLGYAVRDYYLNGGAQAIVVRLAREAGTASIKVGDKLTLEAIGPGTWGNGLVAEVQYPDAASAALVAVEQGVAEGMLFHLAIREGPRDDPRLVETYPNVTLAEGPRRVDTILASSQLIRAKTQFTADNSRPAQKHSNQSPPAEYANDGKGDDGKPLTVAEYTGAGMDAGNQGLYSLRRADLFTLLSLPPSAPDGKVDDSLWASALDLCVDERAILLVDPPPDEKTVDGIKNWIAGRNLTGTGRNAAFYFPRIRRADPRRDGAIREFVPSGAVAGVMARTDTARGIWKAPAGIEAGVVGASGLSVSLTDDENGRLNPFAINSLRTFPTIGTVVWGARTLRGADLLTDDYKYVPVRRLALFLEETLFRNTQWAVFEPNDEPLWSQIRTSVGAFMQDLFRQGAFQGSAPRDAYFVRCSSETTTQYDIDRGIVNIIVGFAPLRPAEFVVVTIQQKTAAGAAQA
jgi:Bacteriophage tail sheath protein